MAIYTSTTPSILRLRQVVARTGVSRSTIYHMVAAGQFPSAVALGARAVGWHVADVDAWLASRPAVREAKPGQWRTPPDAPRAA